MIVYQRAWALVASGWRRMLILRPRGEALSVERFASSCWRAVKVGIFILVSIGAALPEAGLAREAGSSGRLRPFVTDGCSLFPDRALIGKGDWCGCCIAHDLAYWRGGTSEERLAADQALRACVVRVTANQTLAELMFEGVRAGGGPYFYTSYRWGYGWTDNRPYTPLSAEEASLAARLEREYRAREPAPSCPATTLSHIR